MAEDVFIEKINLKAVFLIISLIILFLFGNSFLSFAAQTSCSWTGDGDGTSWEDKDNWDCGTIPNGSQYDVTICDTNAVATSTVTATTTLTLGGLTLGEPGGASTSCNGVYNHLILEANLNLVDDDGSWAGDLNVGASGAFSPQTQVVVIEKDLTLDGGDDSTKNGALWAIAFPPGNTDIAIIKMTGTGTFSVSGHKNDQTEFGSFPGHFEGMSFAYPGQTTTIDSGFGAHQEGNLTFNGGTLIYNQSTTRVAGTSTGTPVQLNGTNLGDSFTGSKVLNIQIINATTDDINLDDGIYGNLNIQLGSSSSGHTASMVGSTTIKGKLLLSGFANNNALTELDTMGYDLTITKTLNLNGSVSGNAPYGRVIVRGDSVLTAGTIQTPGPTNNKIVIQTLNGNTIRAGEWRIDGYKFDQGTSTISMNGTTTFSRIFMDSDSFYNLTLNPISAVATSDDYIGTSHLNIDNDLIMNASLRFDHSDNIWNFGSRNLIVGGDLTINGGFIIPGPTTTVTFDGSTTYTDNVGKTSFYNTYVASSTASASLTLASSATTSYLRVADGESLNLSTGGYTLTLTDATSSSTPLDIDSGATFTVGNSTIVYNSTSTPLTVASTTYYSLTVNDQGNNNTFTVANYIPVLGTFRNLGGIISETTGYISASSSAQAGKSLYNTGESIVFTITDGDENINSTVADTITGTVTAESDTETITLTETGASTGIFSGSIEASLDSISSGNGTVDLPLSGSNDIVAVSFSYTDEQDTKDVSTVSITLKKESLGGGIVGLLGGQGLSSGSGGSVTGPYVNGNTSTADSSAPTNPPTTSPPPAGPVPPHTVVSSLTGPFTFYKTSYQTEILQTILATDSSIYPEGLITGYYGPLTIKAVGRFQDKYSVPLEDASAYGYAGPKTRAKIKEIYSITTTSAQALVDQIAQLTKLVEELQAKLKTLLGE